MDWLASLFSSSGVSVRSGKVATTMAEGVRAPAQTFTSKQCEKKVWPRSLDVKVQTQARPQVPDDRSFLVGRSFDGKINSAPRNKSGEQTTVAPQ